MTDLYSHVTACPARAPASCFLLPSSVQASVDMSIRLTADEFMLRLSSALQKDHSGEPEDHSVCSVNLLSSRRLVITSPPTGYRSTDAPIFCKSHHLHEICVLAETKEEPLTIDEALSRATKRRRHLDDMDIKTLGGLDTAGVSSGMEQPRVAFRLVRLIVV